MKFMINKSDGYILLETAITSICIASLASCMYFFQISAMNIYDCKARVTAEFIAQQCIDEVAILGYTPDHKIVNSNNIDFYVEENVSADDIYEIRLTKVIVSWQYNNSKHKICKEYRYNDKK